MEEAGTARYKRAKTICQGLPFAIILMFGGLEFGMMMTYPDPVLDSLQKKGKCQFVTRDNQHPPEPVCKPKMYSLVAATTSIGAALISLMTPLLSAKLGVKKLVFLASALGALFSLGLIFPYVNNTFVMLIFSRGLMGLVIGTFSAVCPAFIVAVGPEDRSGFFGPLNQIAVTVGVALIPFVCADGATSESAWMRAGFFCLGACAVLAIGVWFVPTVDGGPVPSLKCDKEAIKGFIVTGSFILLQQFTGINAVLSNITTLVGQSDGGISANVASGLASCAQIVGTFASVWTIEHLSRRLSWIISFVTLTISTVVLAMAKEGSPIHWADGSTARNGLTLAAVIIYLLGFGLGAGPLPWFLPAEYFLDPAQQKVACAIVSFVSWIGSFLAIFVFPILQDKMSEFGALLFFACFSFAAIFIGLVFVKEPSHSDRGEPMTSQLVDDIQS